MIWNDCEKQEDGTWIDNVTGIKFGIHENYENSKEGGFLSSPETWMNPNYGRATIPQLTQAGNVITPEGSYTEAGQVDRYRDSSILIVGAGPSTALLTEEDLLKVNHVWSCNHFFKHPKIREINLDLVSLGNEVGLNSKELEEYYSKFPNTLSMMNFTISRSFDVVSKFASKHPLLGYASRWFGRIGEVPRMVTMASLWGAREVRIIGMDGHSPEVLKEKKSDSVFEPGKFLKLSSYDYDYQRRQFVVFFDYMQTVFSTVKIKNLGSRYEHNLCKFIGEE